MTVRVHPCPGLTAEGAVCGAPCKAGLCRRCAARTRRPRARQPKGFTHRFPRVTAQMREMRALYDGAPK